MSKKRKDARPILLCNRRCAGLATYSQACTALNIEYSDVVENMSQASCLVGFPPSEEVITSSQLKTKIGKFPGARVACQKDFQAKIFEFSKSVSPGAFDFWPETFILPNQLDLLKKYMAKRGKKRKTMICKPSASAQGDGIFLFEDFNDIQSRIKTGRLSSNKEWIVQNYIENPLTIDGFKFDLRLYVLIESLEPFRCHICTEGMVRLCTTQYEAPNRRNLNQVMGHLTNYSLNRASSDYVHSENQDDRDASKRTLTTFWQQLASEYPNIDLQNLWEDIKRISHTTLRTLTPLLQASACWFPEQDIEHGRCWQVLGIDILIDQEFKPFLLEVNAGPSLSIEGILEVPSNYEPRNSYEKVCTCVKNTKPHLHQRNVIDQIIKSTVIQGALSIVLGLDHSTRDSWESIANPSLPNLTFINEFMLQQFMIIIQRSNLRWSIRRAVAEIFNIDHYEIEQIFRDTPARLEKQSDCLLPLYLHICEVYSDVASKTYKGSKSVKINPLLHHIRNHNKKTTISAKPVTVDLE